MPGEKKFVCSNEQYLNLWYFKRIELKREVEVRFINEMAPLLVSNQEAYFLLYFYPLREEIDNWITCQGEWNFFHRVILIYASLLLVLLE